MNKTIVTFVGKQVVAAADENKKKLIAKIVPDREVSQVIETGINYIVARLEDGRVIAIFDNRLGTEKLDVKLTLTGLMPHEKFLVYTKEEKDEYRLANLAGILECMYGVEKGNTLALISDIS